LGRDRESGGGGRSYESPPPPPYNSGGRDYLQRGRAGGRAGGVLIDARGRSTCRELGRFPNFQPRDSVGTALDGSTAADGSQTDSRVGVQTSGVVGFASFRGPLGSHPAPPPLRSPTIPPPSPPSPWTRLPIAIDRSTPRRAAATTIRRSRRCRRGLASLQRVVFARRCVSDDRARPRRSHSRDDRTAATIATRGVGGMMPPITARATFSIAPQPRRGTDAYYRK
jgi:hypothetical protein